MSDSLKARPQAPAAPRPIAPKTSAASGTRPAVPTQAASPRPPAVDPAKRPSPPLTPRRTQVTPTPPTVGAATTAAAALPPSTEPERQSDPGSGVAIRDLGAPKAAEEPEELTIDETQVASMPPLTTLSDEAAEQIFTAMSSALQETLLPLLEKQQELEAKLVRLQQLAAQAAQAAAAAPAPSAAPLPVVASSPSRAPVVSTTYGFVTAPQGPTQRPEIEVALERVGPVDVPDFGRGRRSAGAVLVGLLLALVVAAILATILSHT